MTDTAQRRRSGAKLLVIAAIVGAVLFGIFLAYLAWSNDSFPVQKKPFGDYAKVTSSTFNGSEYAFQVQWFSADYLPYQAQLTSPASEAANTPVCGTGLTSVGAGQTLFMPFKITPTEAGLTSVDLSIAVKTLSTGSEFTIVYSVPSVSATAGNIVPSDISCQQPPGVE